MSDTNKTINPATEEALETYSLMSRQEAEGIIEKTHDAFLGWRKTAALIRVKDDAEAMLVANDSIYGLGGGIFSANEDEALRLALPNLPFGGVKQSGYGREHGGFGMHEFVNVKAVMVAQS